MSNVISFRPAPVISRTENLAALLQGVSEGRRPKDDVFWLKENAELLGVLAATSEPLAADALAPYADFYDGIEEKIGFYPQYYRFFLSICLDLEDLGMPGNKAEALCNWVASTGLAQSELSDLQRAEARRLLARRGAAKSVSEGALGERLRHFVERYETFALPNKKAAYELTHIVFYLSEYGKCDPELSTAARTSLEYAGVLAYLDQNHDLLAEVCTALHFAGGTPSDIWSDAVSLSHLNMRPTLEMPASPMADAYHAYLVTGWAQLVMDAPGFEAEVPLGPLFFASDMMSSSALRPLSECLYDLGTGRSGDWSGMRGQVIPYLDPATSAVLQRAEASTDKFDAFFEGFARATPGLVTLAG